MAADYTENELLQMSEQAIKSAREMHRRAVPLNARHRSADFGKNMLRNSLDTDGRTEKISRAVDEVVNAAKSKEQTFSDKKADDGFPSPEKIFKREKSASSCEGCPYVSAVEEQKNDMSVILPLILLLMSEKADFKIIFSLLYILM